MFQTKAAYAVAFFSLLSIIAASCSYEVKDAYNATIPATEIAKSDTDDRSYQFKQLENGLNIIVVSDPTADKAAASMDVHIGALTDPKDREGLSHFLEHMLLLGSETYPQVGEFSGFIAERGGFTNATTGMEQTNYFFQIENESLEPALDRLARFFIDPLFSAKYVDKERNAVNSEYTLRVKDETRRYFEAIKQTANKNHPMNQFSVGNLETLSDNEKSTILSDVKEHYDKYYSADIMSLSVVGNYTTDELMTWAETKFSAVPSKGDTRKWERPVPFLPDQEGIKIFINTLEEDYSVRLVFALPDARPYYRSKPVEYIAEQLKYEGPGGLHDALSKKGKLKYFGVSTWGPDDFSQLQVNIGLTKDGYSEVNQIVDYFFTYIDLIKKDAIRMQRFEETKRLKALEFKYQTKGRVSDFARGLSRNLQYFPPQHALNINQIYYKFDGALIDSYFDYITPEKARVIIGGPDISSTTKEARYGADYITEPLKALELELWSQPNAEYDLSLPGENKYIPKDLSLRSEATAQAPKLAYEKAGISLWFENENEFNLPKASLNFRVYSNRAFENPEHNVAMNLHTRIINDTLGADSYFAKQAGLTFRLSTSSRNYNVLLQGYNDGLEKFLLRTLGAFDPDQISREQFLRIKENYSQDLYNRRFARPMSQVRSAVSVEGDTFTPSDEVKLAKLDTMTFDDFLRTLKGLHSSLEIEGVFTGNIEDSDVRSIGDILSASFKSQLVSDGKLPFPDLRLQEGSDKIREIKLDNNDSAIAVIIQGGKISDEEIAKYYLTTQLLQSRFFKSLRTEQQLGYVVSMSNFSFYQVPSLLFSIQSPIAHPSILRDKIDLFLAEQVLYFESLDAEEFQKNKVGLLSNINKKYDNVYQKGNVLNRAIIYEDLAFDRNERLSKAIGEVSLDEMKSFYRSHIIGPSRRRMTVWSVGNKHDDEPSYNSSNFDLCYADKCIKADGK